MFNKYQGVPSGTPFLDAMRNEVVKMAGFGGYNPYLDKQAGNKLQMIDKVLSSGGMLSNIPATVGAMMPFGSLPGRVISGGLGGAVSGGLYGGVTGAIRDDSNFWEGARRGAALGSGVGALGAAATYALPEGVSKKTLSRVLGLFGAGGTAASIAAASPYGDQVFKNDPWYTPQGIQDRLSGYQGYNPYLDKQAAGIQNLLPPPSTISNRIGSGLRNAASYLPGAFQGAIGGGLGGAMTGGMYGGITGMIRDDITGWEGLRRGALGGGAIGALGGAVVGGPMYRLAKQYPMGVEIKPAVLNALKAGPFLAGIGAALPVADDTMGNAPWYTPEGIQDRLSAYYGYNPYL